MARPCVQLSWHSMAVDARLQSVKGHAHCRLSCRSPAATSVPAASTSPPSRRHLPRRPTCWLVHCGKHRRRQQHMQRRRLGRPCRCVSSSASHLAAAAVQFTKWLVKRYYNACICSVPRCCTAPSIAALTVAQMMCFFACAQADGQCQSVAEISVEDHRFPLLRWMLDVRAALARGNISRRVLSMQPKLSISRVKLKRNWSEQALLSPPRDKKTRKLMQRAERRAQQASMSQAPPTRRKGSHAPKTVRGAAVPSSAKARSPSDNKRRRNPRAKTVNVDIAAGTNRDKRKGRKPAEQRKRQGKDARTLRRSAEPARGRGKAVLGAGRQHGGWSAE